MSVSDNDIAIIQKYFDNEINEEELAVFEARKKSSMDFAKEVEVHQAMMGAIRVNDESLLRAELKREVKNLDITEEKRKFKWYYAVAAISIIAMATYLILPNYSSLFKSYYTILPESPIVRNELNNSDRYAEGMQQYSLGQYEKALIIFSNLEEPKRQIELSLYIGNSFLNLRKPEEAIESLQAAVNAEKGLINDHGKWYTALAHLANEDKQQAKEVLTNLSSYENSYQEKAQSLLDELTWTFF